MPTLKETFNLFDGYTSAANNVITKTDQATNKILKASGATDKLNTKLESTGASANIAGNGLGKFINIAAIVADAIKGMNIADSYTNTGVKLGLLTDNLQDQLNLQNQIFDAANRSRGSYTAMADSVSKLGSLKGNVFSGNKEIVQFTELMQKAFKLSGASPEEQQSGMSQLTQSMASGKLQGDDLSSISENAPLLYNAIAKYMGKSKGELQNLGAEGAITSTIIKNSLFAAANDINTKFKKMPYTFGDIWNRIKNGGLQAFASVITKVDKLINTKGFQGFVSDLINSFYSLADAASKTIDTIISIYSFISSNWPILGPIIMGLVGVMLLYNAVSMITNGILAIQAVLTTILESPIMLIIAVIILVIAIIYSVIGAINQFAGTSISATGVIFGAFAVVGAFIANAVIAVWNLLMEIAADVYNLFVDIANFLANIFVDPIGAINRLFVGMANFVLGIIKSLAGVIDDLFGSKLSKHVQSMQNSLTKWSKDQYGTGIEVATKINPDKFKLNRIEYKDTYKAAYGNGKSVDSKVSSKLNDLLKGSKTKTDLGTDADPTTVKGTGSNGTVNVDMSDEDIGYLRDLAEREFVNKFTTATLAPKTTIKFGDVHKTADAKVVAREMKKILRDQIATAAEG